MGIGGRGDENSVDTVGIERCLKVVGSLRTVLRG
jgi:hypothetical protein